MSEIIFLQLQDQTVEEDEKDIYGVRLILIDSPINQDENTKDSTASTKSTLLNSSVRNKIVSEESSSSVIIHDVDNQSKIHCFLCEQIFNSKFDLEDHLNFHSTDTFFECPDCADIVANLELFIAHINDSHNAEIDLKRTRSQLEKPFMPENEDSQEDLFKNFEDPNFEDSESDKWSDDETVVKTVKKRNIGKFSCELCDSRFVFKNMLDLHIKKIHVGIRKSEFLSEDDTETEKFECHFCGTKLYSKQSLRIHLRHHVKPTICPFCSEGFSDQRILQNHLKVHIGGPNCLQCKRYFPTRIEYQSHVKEFHEKKTAFLCKTCNKVFKKSSDLKKHERIHTGVKPYVCECGKAFTHQTSLRHHKLTHNGSSEKLFVCSYCGKGFNYAGNLKVHIRKHTGQKPYKCKVCFKAFARSANLNEHMCSHLSLKTHHCKICDKSFTSSSALSKHKKIHLGVKDFVCAVCQKRFLTQGHLASHNRIHSDERKFECKFCSKEFRRIDTLKSHVKTHERLKQEQFKRSQLLYKSQHVENANEIQAQPTYELQEQPEQETYQVYQPVPIVAQEQIYEHSMTSMAQEGHPINLEYHHYPITSNIHDVQSSISYEPLYIPQPSIVAPILEDQRLVHLYPYPTPQNVPSYYVDQNLPYTTTTSNYQYNWPSMDPPPSYTQM